MTEVAPHAVISGQSGAAAVPSQPKSTDDTAVATDENKAVVAATKASAETSSTPAEMLDTESLVHDSLSVPVDDSRRTSALSLEGLPSDRKSEVLETRLRTVRYVLKHQSAINDELVAYCNMCHTWMLSVDRALAERNIHLDTPVPPAFQLQRTLTPSSAQPSQDGVSGALQGGSASTAKTATAAVTSPRSQQQLYSTYPNFRNRRAVSAANVNLGSLQQQQQQQRTARNVAMGGASASLENMGSVHTGMHAGTHNNYHRTAAVLGQTNDERRQQQSTPNMVVGPEASLGHDRGASYQIMKLLAANSNQQREWHSPQQPTVNNAFTGLMGSPWDAQDYHPMAPGGSASAFSSQQHYAMHAAPPAGMHHNPYQQGRPTGAQYNYYSPHPVDWDIDSEGEDYSRYAAGGRGGMLGAASMQFPEVDFAEGNRGYYMGGGGGHWWTNKGSWDTGMRVGPRRSGGQNRGSGGRSPMGSGGGTMKGGVSTAVHGAGGIRNVGSAAGAAVAAEARKKLLSKEQTTTTTTTAAASTGTGSKKEVSSPEGSNAPATTTKVKKEVKSPSTTTTSSKTKTEGTTEKGNTNESTDATNVSAAAVATTATTTTTAAAVPTTTTTTT